MRETVLENLTRRFELYADLVNQADDVPINPELDVPRSRSLGMRLRCIVGTRRELCQGDRFGRNARLAVIRGEVRTG